MKLSHLAPGTITLESSFKLSSKAFCLILDPLIYCLILNIF